MAQTLHYRVGGWPAEDVTIRVARTPADLAEVRSWMRQRTDQPIGYDAETNALDPFNSGFRLRAVQLADVYESWVIINSPEINGTVTELLSEHPRLVAHFAENDIRFAVRGLPGRPIRLGELEPHVVDTQVALALYDPRTVSSKKGIDPRIPLVKGLKPTSERLLSSGLREAEDALHARFRQLAPVGHRVGQKSKTWGFANIPDDDPFYLIYAGLDPLVTLRLYLLMRHALEQRGQLGRLEAAFREQWMMDQATLAGMQVDGPYARWLWDQLTAVIEQDSTVLLAHGVATSGMGPSVGKAFTTLGIEPVKLKDGKPCWDKEALAKLSGAPGQVGALALAITAVRRATKFRSTYIAPMLRAIEHGDGAMHCSVRAIGTVTTRMSAMGTETSGPLHQLPKKDPRVRAAVRARRGHVLVSADFSQGEPFTMAALSGDDVYLRDLEAGDINSAIASMIYGAEFDPAHGKNPAHPSYLLRQQAKAGWLALCYGAGAQKFADTLKMSLEAGAAARLALRGRYTRLWQFADFANQHTMIELDSGAKVPLWDRAFYDPITDAVRFGDRPSRLGLNGWTQGAQGDLLKLALHRLAAWGWTWALRFALHDELLLEVPEPMAEAARLALEDAMTIRYRGVWIRCEAVIEGRTWLPQPKAFGELSTMEDEDDDD